MTDNSNSMTVKASSRTYFFDLKQTKEEKTFLVITESRKTDKEQFERHSIAVFPEDVADFLEATQVMISKLG